MTYPNKLLAAVAMFAVVIVVVISAAAITGIFDFLFFDIRTVFSSFVASSLMCTI